MSETQEKNKALVRRFYELDVRGDIEAMEKLLAPDFVDHSLLPDQDPGREGYLKSSRRGACHLLQHPPHYRGSSGRRG